MEASSYPKTFSRSDKYFYANGDCYVKVDSTIYRIHFYHLRESTHFFDNSLQIRSDHTALVPNSPGSDEQNLLPIEGVLTQDFEALLWFFYESQYTWTYGVAHCQAVWESVLLLAEKFAMSLVAKAACRALALSGILDDVQKVALANKFNLGQAWAYDSLERIVTRKQAISAEEAIRLGYAMTASLSQAREVVLTARESCATPVCSTSLRTCLCYHGVHVCSPSGCSHPHAPTVCPRGIDQRPAATQALADIVLTVSEDHTKLNLRGCLSGDLFCKVGHKTFRVHSHHLARSSDVFSAMLALPSETTGSRAGTREENPVILPGVSIQDFRALVEFFYVGPYVWGKSTTALSPRAQSRWESLLRIGDKFDMHDICKVAVYALGERSSVLGDVRKISLFTKYDLDKTFLLAQLRNLCRRADGLSVEEGCDVGLVMGMLIARAREALTKRAFAARRQLEATDEEAEEVVKEVILAAYSS